MPVFEEKPAGLVELETDLRRDLEKLSYPRRSWLSARKHSNGNRVLDVVIVGGGQSGLAVAFGLQREDVSNIVVLDQNDPNYAGPWRTFARMITLRTPKHLTGPDLGIPGLTIESWYEAIHGEGSWGEMELIPKETWAAYLNWYREFLEIPVRSNTRVGAIEWDNAECCFEVPVSSPTGDAVLYARRVVLATGINGSGRWTIPDLIRGALPPEAYAHTRDEIDFEALRGKRVAVLGAGASAFDNAAVALETGARDVHLFFRRDRLPNVNPYRWAEFVGYLGHHGDLPDAQRWRFISEICRMGQLPPTDTFYRATQHSNFHLHPGSQWESIEMDGEEILIHSNKGEERVDFIICGTGFETNLKKRPELEKVVDRIALWSDRYEPDPSDTNQDLLRHPYLGAGFEFLEKVPGESPWVSFLYNYTFGCLLSLGFGGASISGMKYSIPRIVGSLTRSFYVEDAELHFESLRKFDLEEYAVSNDEAHLNDEED